MDFPIYINWMSSFSTLGLSSGIFIFFIQIVKKLTLETLIRRRRTRRLILYISHKKDDMLIWVNALPAGYFSCFCCRLATFFKINFFSFFFFKKSFRKAIRMSNGMYSDQDRCKIYQQTTKTFDFLYLLQTNWTQISSPMRLTQNLTTHAQCLLKSFILSNGYVG